MRYPITPSLVAGAVISAIALASPPPKHDAIAYAPPATAPATVTLDAEVLGRVHHFLVTPLGTVEGLLLDGDIQVLFPAYMGERIAAGVRHGDLIGVAGRFTAQGAIEADSILNPQGRTIGRLAPPPEPAVQGGEAQALEARGRVKVVLRGTGGGVVGVVLADGTVVHLAAHLLRMLGTPVPGMLIAVSGYGRQTALGRGIEATAVSEQ